MNGEEIVYHDKIGHKAGAKCSVCDDRLIPGNIIKEALKEMKKSRDKLLIKYNKKYGQQKTN